MRINGQPTIWQRVNSLLRSGISSGGIFGTGRQSAFQYGLLRDLYAILGYDTEPEFNDYLGKYRRDDVAAKIVDAGPRATWTRSPDIVDPADPESQFIEDWLELSEDLRVPSFWHLVDRLAGIGHYGVLLIGERGGNLEEPLPMNLRGPESIIFLAAFHEGRTEIDAFDTDATSSRFGLPEMYEIVTRQESRARARGRQRDIARKKVHWTRIIHVAEDLIEDQVFGRPRLERVYNRLDDLMKVAGGSAEMFWQNVARLWHINLGAEFEADADQLKEMEEQLVEVQHGLRRVLSTQGADVEALGAESPDPGATFNVLKELIAAGSEIPQRILFGSERGELASTQDEKNFLKIIASRQVQFAEPVIVREFIDRMIDHGVLTEPAEGYLVVWPTLFELTELEKADLQQKKAAAILAGAPFGDTTLLVPPHEFREEVLGLPPEIPDPPDGTEGNVSNVLALQEFDRAAPDQFWKTIHRVADGLAPRVARAFRDAVRETQRQTNLADLEEALNSGDLAALEAALPMDVFQRAFGAGSGPFLEQAFLRTAELAAREAAGQLGLRITFDTTAANVPTFRTEEVGRLVRQISSETQRAIREIVDQGFGADVGSNFIATSIRDLVGLTRSQMQAVINARTRLIAQGLSGADLDRAVLRTYEQKVRERAATIARTETIRAANAGQVALVKQLERDGLIPMAAMEWIVTPDDRLCPICEPMDGQVRPVGASFVSPFDGSRAAFPPIHVNCRCALSPTLVTAADVPDTAPSS